MSQPIAVKVFLPSLLYQAASGQASVTVEATTWQECLDALLARYPLIRPHLFDDQGSLRQHVNIFMNDQNSRWLKSLDQPVRSGDTITILQAISGG